MGASSDAHSALQNNPERMKKTIPPRTKEPFSLEIAILGLKFSFSLEDFNPGLVFLRPEGLRMKTPFSIENFILH